MKFLSQVFPETLRATLGLRYFGFFKIPLLFYVQPSILELSEERVVIRIPLTRRTRNHLNSMYFGALSIGADCAAGLIAMDRIRSRPEKIALIFKDFSAEFLKRAEDDVYFCCEQGRKITDLVEKAAVTGVREEMPIHVIATVPNQFGEEPVAKFELTISMKKRS